MPTVIEGISKKTGKKYKKVLFSKAEKIGHYSKVAKKDSVKKNGEAYSEPYRARARGYLEANSDATRMFKKQHPKTKRKTKTVRMPDGRVTFANRKTGEVA